MKKVNSKIITGALTAMMVLGLIGCSGKETPQSLLADMAEKSSEIESAEMNMKMEVEAGGEVMGTAIDMNIKLDMDIQSTNDPEAAYIDGKVLVSMLGEKETTIMKAYTVKENDVYATYSQEGEDGQWYRIESETPESSGSIDLASLKDVYESFELEEETETFQDAECYVLKGMLGGDTVKDIMGSAMDAMGDSSDLFEGTDWDSAEIPMKIYIAKDSHYPAKITMDMQAVIQAVFEEESTGIDCNTCMMEISYTSYNSIEEITVPDDVISSAEASSEAAAADAEEDGSDAGIEVSDEVLKGTAQESKLGNDWDSMTVAVNDTVLTFPCTYKQFAATGLVLDPEGSITEDTAILAENLEDADVQMSDDDSATALVTFYNSSKEAVKVSSALVTGISVSDFDLSDTDTKVVFPGKVELGMKIDEVTAVYGEADETYDMTDTAYSIWYLSSDDAERSIYVEYNKDDKKVVSIMMEYLVW